MSDEYEEKMKVLNQGISEALAAAMQVNFKEESEAGVIVLGSITVIECMDQNGRRWLARLALDGQGETGKLPGWQVQGYLHNALNESWDERDDSDD